MSRTSSSRVPKICSASLWRTVVARNAAQSRGSLISGSSDAREPVAARDRGRILVSRGSLCVAAAPAGELLRSATGGAAWRSRGTRRLTSTATSRPRLAAPCREHGASLPVVWSGPRREGGPRPPTPTAAALRRVLAPFTDHERLVVYLDRDGGEAGSVWVHLTGDRAWVTHFTQIGGPDSCCRDAGY